MKLILIFSVFFLTYNPVAASDLMCYSCSTTIMMGCNASEIDPPPLDCTKFLPADPRILPLCRRITGLIQLPGGRTLPEIVRECVPYARDDPSIPYGCHKQTMPLWEGKVELCVCGTDKCNGHGDIGNGARLGGRSTHNHIWTHFSLFTFMVAPNVF